MVDPQDMSLHICSNKVYFSINLIKAKNNACNVSNTSSQTKCVFLLRFFNVKYDVVKQCTCFGLKIYIFPIYLLIFEL